MRTAPPCATTAASLQGPLRKLIVSSTLLTAVHTCMLVLHAYTTCAWLEQLLMQQRCRGRCLPTALIATRPRLVSRYKRTVTVHYATAVSVHTTATSHTAVAHT
jgi:hypothetical protein